MAFSMRQNCTQPARRIVNTYDQMRAAAGGGLPPVFISAFTGGSGSAYAWAITSPGRRLDEGQPQAWYEQPSKTFGTTSYLVRFREGKGSSPAEQKRNALALAKQWAEKRFPVKQWKRNRMGDYIDARVFKEFSLRKA